MGLLCSLTPLPTISACRKNDRWKDRELFVKLNLIADISKILCCIEPVMSEVAALVCDNGLCYVADVAERSG